MQSQRGWTRLSALAVAVAACGGHKTAVTPPPPANTIGAAGGSVSLADGTSVIIPPGALAAATVITIARSGNAAPAGAISALYEFGPEGTNLAKPASVSFPVPAGVTGGSVYWTKPGSSDGFDVLGGTLANGAMSALVTHFSRGFVGALCSPGAACTPSNACRVGSLICSSGTPVCADSGINVVDGSTCGGNNVCNAGSCVAACVSNASCTPAGASDPCKTYSTSCASSTAPPGCDASGNQADGAGCGGGKVCSSGACVAACAPNAACTPAGTLDPCKTYSTTCASSTATPGCGVSGNQSDGTGCGGTNVCTGGTCSPPPTRTVSGTVQTLFQTDDGAKTLVPGWVDEFYPVTVSGVLIPDSSPAGYTVLPGTQDAGFHFTVPNVPVGRYFLQVDTFDYRYPQVQVVRRTLYEMSTSTPDLTTVTHGRPDRKAPTQETLISVNVSDSLPWTTNDRLSFLDSQGASDVSNLSGQISVGSTTLNFQFSWSTRGELTYLPNASEGDVTYLDHRAATRVTSVSGGRTDVWRYAAEYAKLFDVTFVDGVPGSVMATLSAAPQTGSLATDFRSSQFAALSGFVNPAASPVSPGSYLLVDATPDPFSSFSVDRNQHTTTGSLSIANATADVDYGVLHYGQFLDALWNEYVSVGYDYTMSLSGPGGAAPVSVQDSYISLIPKTSAPAVYVPTLGPPTLPKINVQDAFKATSVGAAPLISWSPPSMGSATRYSVEIALQGNPADGDVAILDAVIYSGTSFKVPGTFLKPGQLYSGNVTAISSPEHLDGPPFQQGLPYTSIGTDFGLFGP